MYGLTSQIVEAEKVLGALLQASGYASGFDPTRRSPSLGLRSASYDPTRRRDKFSRIAQFFLPEKSRF